MCAIEIFSDEEGPLHLSRQNAKLSRERCVAPAHAVGIFRLAGVALSRASGHAAYALYARAVDNIWTKK